MPPGKGCRDPPGRRDPPLSTLHARSGPRLMMTRNAWLALDVGGANLKAAHSSGAASSTPFPLWKRPEQLAAAIRKLVGAMPPAERSAVTMTGELCDCFRTK